MAQAIQAAVGCSIELRARQAVDGDRRCRHRAFGFVEEEVPPYAQRGFGQLAWTCGTRIVKAPLARLGRCGIVANCGTEHGVDTPGDEDDENKPADEAGRQTGERSLARLHAFLLCTEMFLVERHQLRQRLAGCFRFVVQVVMAGAGHDLQ